MLPLALFSGYFTLLASALLMTHQALDRQIQLLSSEIERASVEQYAQSVREYFDDQNRFAADLAQMIATPGYEYAKSFDLPNIYYQVSPLIGSSGYRFTRASVAWTGREASRDRMTQAQFFDAANNTCGAGAFNDAGSWCGSGDGYWWKHESRWKTSAALESARVDLTRTLSKFSAIFSLRNPYNFPGADVGLNPGDTVALYALMGAPATASACATSTGIFRFQGFEFDCSDLFIAASGAPVHYTYVDPYYIVVSGKTLEINSGGQQIVVSQEMLAD
ncbi:hypothetical protein [Sinimarinibacterium sp. NLF-5-8]|uniref:hypothetical protein n=1 Tax=Sinimarinibacterium sp. NLF-5-8 TaxID=2698684 RepID=UPI00137BEA00|nr:hypothetical protein [Sinimarinibacterium sp. NLF-5-8]QHS09129.1 hypothetical protein GT972_02480 [Sinimarinibacterium sp. NLF-5-8]